MVRQPPVSTDDWAKQRLQRLQRMMVLRGPGSYLRTGSSIPTTCVRTRYCKSVGTWCLCISRTGINKRHSIKFQWCLSQSREQLLSHLRLPSRKPSSTALLLLLLSPPIPMPTTFLCPYSAFPQVRLSSIPDLHPRIGSIYVSYRGRYIVIVCSETLRYR